MGPAEKHLRNLIDVELPAAAEAFHKEKKAPIDAADKLRDPVRKEVQRLRKAQNG